MPPRIRNRATKTLKENNGTASNVKSIKITTKASRKPLADKTNSASDDNTEVSKPSKKTASKSSNVESRSNSKTNSASDDKPKISKPSKKTANKSSNVESKNMIRNTERPRRDRRLPTRFVENPILINLSNNSKHSNSTTPENTTANTSKSKHTGKRHAPIENSDSEVSPFKTPSKTDKSLVMSRPRRICRLPSRFDDQVINNYIPMQPGNASTPIQQSKSKVSPSAVDDKENGSSKKQPQSAQPSKVVKTAVTHKKSNKNVSLDKNSPDTNNNAKGRSTRAKKGLPIPSPKKISPKINSIKRYFKETTSPLLSPMRKVSPPAKTSKRIVDKSLSFKVLGGKKRSPKSDKNDMDIYEFTFDPDEEPKPQKKKRKKPDVKKPTKVTKPKSVVTYKSIYDQNISKALTALKNAVKPIVRIEPLKLPQIQEVSDDVAETQQHHIASSNNTSKVSQHEGNYPSIRVEDIAADIEPSLDHHDDLDYSPVNSPVANPVLDPRHSPERLPNNDPLNLQEDLSFFDDIPVASSSMNMSVRHPLASPWRVEFGSLPIKWHSNTYVKPNMTPAVESSFICSEDSNKKKHVYTNMVPQSNDSLPQIVSETSNLKQTSIISFIKEVAERKAKKKRGRSVSPSKAIAVKCNNAKIERNRQAKNQQTEKASNDATSNDPLLSNDPVCNNNTSGEVSSGTNDVSEDKENSKEGRKTRKRKNDENICERPAKSPRKQKDKDCTYFGFDDSENQDQENLSPSKAKVISRGRSLRPRSRAVLQEINGPTRAVLPIAAKSKVALSSDAVNKVYEELKSAADASVFPEKNVECNATNIEELSDDNADSVHLFDDIEVVHHLKPTRKSYGKSKKVTFQHYTTSDVTSQEAIACHIHSSFEDDFGDPTFDLLHMKEKKKSKKKNPKKLRSKEEEKQAEEWAAGFNSMCEEIEDFPLVVE